MAVTEKAASFARRQRIVACAFLMAVVGAVQAQDMHPHLERRGDATQLSVDGTPMILLAGELHNSSSSSLEYMQPEWEQLARMGLNTVLVPVSWELTEPVEGAQDFALVDGLLLQARAQHMHMVFLWLAAWKNGNSGYPPVWVKEDTKRFPRAIFNGGPTSTLSTFSPALEAADARAFRALMQHLKQVDGEQHTVVMMQVENEVGILGATRDHSAMADAAFAGPVPDALLEYLQTHRQALDPDLRALWESNGGKHRGSWTEVFGTSTRTDEIFMAWRYGSYVQAVAAAGKTGYDIPMYANAWLAALTAAPGSYPTGGPLPQVMDVWKAAGHALDMLSPDLYDADVAGWSKRFHRADNPLFLPETNSGQAGAQAIFYILGEQGAIGFSPFGIDARLHGEPAYGPPLPPGSAPREDGQAELTQSYVAMAEVLPELLQAETTSDAHGFVLSEAQPSVDFAMHGVIVHVSLDELFGHRAKSGYGLVLQESPGHFLGAGKGFRVSFEPQDKAAARIRLAAVTEGHFHEGTWVPGRRLNGDEDDQGNNWRFDSRAVHIERASTYQQR